jgi:hypothetical protein
VEQKKSCNKEEKIGIGKNVIGRNRKKNGCKKIELERRKKGIAL